MADPDRRYVQCMDMADEGGECLVIGSLCTALPYLSWMVSESRVATLNVFSLLKCF